MNFKKITETPSNHNNLEQLSSQEILNKINDEDQKVALAVKKVIKDINALVGKIIPLMKTREIGIALKVF